MIRDLEPQKNIEYLSETLRYLDKQFKRRAQYPKPVLISSSLFAGERFISRSGDSSNS